MKRIHALLTVLALSAGLLVFMELRDRRPPAGSYEPNWLVKKYGAKHFSQNDEELIIRDFFGDRKGGVFVDIGANHYRTNSTTYYLEKYLGWTGLAVDAICSFRKEYEIYRPGTRFFCFFVSDRSEAETEFYINLQNKRISTGDEGLAKKQGDFATQKVATVTMNELLRRTGVERFDLLSLDIELAEPAALAGFDIERYRPALVCIEAHEEVRRRVLDYFAGHGYRKVETYDGLDPLNYYFTPNNPGSPGLDGSGRTRRRP